MTMFLCHPCLTDVVEHRDAARRLHDPPETAGGAAKLRQSRSGSAPHELSSGPSSRFRRPVFVAREATARRARSSVGISTRVSPGKFSCTYRSIEKRDTNPVRSAVFCAPASETESGIGRIGDLDVAPRSLRGKDVAACRRVDLPPSVANGQHRRLRCVHSARWPREEFLGHTCGTLEGRVKFVSPNSCRSGSPQGVFSGRAGTPSLSRGWLTDTKWRRWQRRRQCSNYDRA